MRSNSFPSPPGVNKPYFSIVFLVFPIVLKVSYAFQSFPKHPRINKAYCFIVFLVIFNVFSMISCVEAFGGVLTPGGVARYAFTKIDCKSIQTQYSFEFASILAFGQGRRVIIMILVYFFFSPFTFIRKNGKNTLWGAILLLYFYFFPFTFIANIISRRGLDETRERVF